MKEIHQDVDYGTGTIRLVLQFPEEPQDTALIHTAFTDAALLQKEVREILLNELQRQIKASLVQRRGDCQKEERR